MEYSKEKMLTPHTNRSNANFTKKMQIYKRNAVLQFEIPCMYNSEDRLSITSKDLWSIAIMEKDKKKKKDSSKSLCV